MAIIEISKIATGGSVEVGVRELRDHLSRHLASVREGHTITITDHGRPIARIMPVDAPTKLEEWIAQGLVTPAEQRRGPLPDPVESSETVSDLVGEQRR
ncbi:type II toxin-antitoxin system prevent-host-death family antitoxin [Ammonicoccus fulvus]|uniref:Antitoxin n=1 Tax=Ammonicoccus fulvus TaxID=3138240 RepID=A0ABZ3FSH4_9ACTN